MGLIAILVFYFAAGFTAAVIDYYAYDDMMGYYNTCSAGVNGSTSDS